MTPQSLKHKVVNLEKYDNSTLQRHLLVLTTFMEIALQADPPHIKALQNYLVELTSIIERARSTVSRDSICMAMGILFKYSGALLDVQSGSDAEYADLGQGIDKRSISILHDADNAASVQAGIEASAAVTRTNLSRSELAALWTRDDLAEYCTDSLIPAEGGIQRLHAGVYRQGLKNYSVKKPAITDEQIEILFKRLIPFLHRPEVLRMIVWMIGHEDSSGQVEQSEFVCRNWIFLEI
ncbi:hypothetical protein OSTOST_19575, partial [Ostertagia ostertagi]